MQRWDIFCAVVDNYGDIGTCWRLARQLEDEHQVEVRLWVDRLESFARLCPSIKSDLATQCVGTIQIRRWEADFPIVEVADVVIEAFACEIPPAYVAAMAQKAEAPIWVNLEYLSAESWVEGCHLLTSAQSRSPVRKYFFFPGFTFQTGGLLREGDLLEARAAFDETSGAELWRALGITSDASNSDRTGSLSDGDESCSRVHDELRISLFCYQNSALPKLLQCWSDGPEAVLVLTSPGAATDQVADGFGEELSLGKPLARGSLTVQALPFLSQPLYDRLLWACDVNFVRGEDSFVRAQWAQKPFVWQIYPQTESAHFAKLDAFLAQYLGKFENAEIVRRCFHAWNGVGDMESAWRNYLSDRLAIQRYGKLWVSELDRAGNLADNLVRFVCGKYTVRGHE